MEKAKEYDFSFWKNLILVIVFFTITPLTLGASLYSLLSFNYNQETGPSKSIYSQDLKTNISGVKVYASLPTNFPSVGGSANAQDARAEVIKEYLSRYKSPLVPFANYIVSVADEYKIDYRLITAIAQQESNLCKIIPEGTYNCWGWGIHSAGTLGFSSFEEGIKTVTKGLAQNYIALGLNTPEKIMSKYTPLSNGSWARGVEEFLSEME